MKKFLWIPFIALLMMLGVGAVAENAEAFAGATLSKEGSAIYLTVKPLSEAATMISIF